MLKYELAPFSNPDVILEKLKENEINCTLSANKKVIFLELEISDPNKLIAIGSVIGKLEALEFLSSKSVEG